MHPIESLESDIAQAVPGLPEGAYQSLAAECVDKAKQIELEIRASKRDKSEVPVTQDATEYFT